MDAWESLSALNGEGVVDTSNAANTTSEAGQLRNDWWTDSCWGEDRSVYDEC